MLAIPGKNLLLLAALLACTVLLPAWAQRPPAKHLTTLPFTMLTGGIVIVQATMDDGKDSLNFVLDTGSGGISIDSATCNLLRLKKEKSNRTIRGIAGVKAVEFTYGHTLNFKGLSVPKLDFHINDYDILTSVYGIKIDGIIGYSFFRRFIVTLDYDKMNIKILSPGSFKYPRGGTLLKPQFSTLPMQTLTVKDKASITHKMYYDMGAGLCLLLSTAFIKDSSLLEDKKKMFPTQAEGLGGKAQMTLTVIKELRLGPYRFKKVPTYIFDDDYNVTSYPLVGGLLGNDILRRFNVVINYPDQQIYLKPNLHFKDSFDYSYTGLGIYLVDGFVTIVDLMKNSPAAKAGFESGDIIVGINTNFSGNIQTYKAMLQSSNTILKVVIRRAGDLLTIPLKVRSIRDRDR